MRAMQKSIINGNGIASVQAQRHLGRMVAHRDVIRFYAGGAVNIGLRKASVYRGAPMMAAWQNAKCAVLRVGCGEIA